MDNLTRLQYLQAMGVDVWVPKATGIEGEPHSVDKIEFNSTEQAEKQIDSAGDQWTDLQNEVAECKKCDLCNSRAHTVFGVGSHNADWLLIGEAPKESEAIEGNPFVGQADLLLTEMIRAIGLQRDEVFITNIIKCSPPNNRDPSVEETKACYAYLQRQILLIKPKIILALGRVAAQSLLNTNEPLSKLRSVPHQLAGIPLIAVYHPNYLLRSLLEKRKAWQDLQLAIEQIKK
jgi:DNA polymerase